MEDKNIPILTARQIFKSYGNVEVLKGVDIQIFQKEVISIVGPSGAGKSTLLHIIGTLDKADKGELKFEDKHISGLNSNQLAAFRNNKIGFIFQFHHLLPEFSALENICIPAFIKGISKKEAIDKAKNLLDMLSLSHRLNHRPSELSGGEQQRVAVARALINNPLLILADEPSGNLDTENALKLHELFFTLRDSLNQSFVIVTHNNDLAKMSDRIINMKDGQVIND